jgi:hypothetical protein
MAGVSEAKVSGFGHSVRGMNCNQIGEHLLDTAMGVAPPSWVQFHCANAATARRVLRSYARLLLCWTSGRHPGLRFISIRVCGRGCALSKRDPDFVGNARYVRSDETIWEIPLGKTHAATEMAQGKSAEFGKGRAASLPGIVVVRHGWLLSHSALADCPSIVI